MDHGAPVALAHHVALLVAQPRLRERFFLIGEEGRPVRGVDERVQEGIDAERFHAARQRERIGAGEAAGTGELVVDVAAIIGYDVGINRLDRLVLIDRGGDAGHRRQVIGPVQALDAGGHGTAHHQSHMMTSAPSMPPSRA